MHIVIAGGHGLLGRALTARLRRDAHTVSVLTRTARGPHDLVWEPTTPGGSWRQTVGASDAVVNLAGEPIADARWTTARKAAILESRVRATRALAEAIVAAPAPPGVFISASAIGVYGPLGDERVTEATPHGDDFLAGVCAAWEHEAQAAAGVTRLVLARTGVVLAREGGALPKMALPFRLFVGGPLGSGRQYVSWIHLDDWVEMMHWALITPAVRGPLNVTAPEPVTNAELARSLGRALRRPAVLPAPAFALRLVLGDMADTLLSGQRVIPAQAEALGFQFRFPTLDPALRSLIP